MHEIYADLAVIGSGPAGQKAAIQAAKLGRSVIVIEQSCYPGGSSLSSGTIPSKTLREAILDLTDFYKRSFYGMSENVREISINDLMYRLQVVWEKMRKMLSKQFEKNKIRLIHGLASFENDHLIRVVDDQSKVTHQIRAEKLIVATGSRPRNPKNVPFDQEMVLDSTRLLDIDHLPKKLIVLGGGIIGSEYASFFAALGTEVIIIDRKDHLLPYLDREIGVHLQNALAEINLKFVGKKEFDQIIRLENEVRVEFKDGSHIIGEMLLYALGREANVEGLMIENAGIHLDQKGYIPVNALFQTVKPHIYAVGDVIGAPALASTSMEQGRLAARHAFGAATRYFPTLYPIGIYTIPDISCCGLTEEELQKLQFNYEVGRAYYYEIARSQMAGDNLGMFKILFHADTLEILGVHIVGKAATELIHIGQIAMTFNARIDYFIDQVFNYPTYAEGYRIAALNGMNKVKHRK